MSGLSSQEASLLRRMNIGDIPRRSAEHYADRVAILFRGQEVTSRELNENCCRCANAFAEMGIGKGDRVAFMTHNCLHYIYGWMGLAKIGAIIAPLNFMLKAAELEDIINHAGAKAFFVEDILAEEVLKAADKLPTVQNFGWIKITGGAEKPDGWIDMEDFFAPGRDASEPEVAAGDGDVVTLMYTSGTEASPKGVMNSHANFFSLLAVAFGDLNISKDDVCILSIPLYHIAAKFLLLAGFAGLCKIVLEYAPNPIEIMELTQKERITYWVYPPTLYQILPSMPDFDKCDLSSLAKCISFGAFMPRPLLEQWKKIVPQVEWRNYYGQTESSPLGSTLQPEDFDRKTESIGKPHINVSMKIFDDDDNEVPRGMVGEIVMRGPSVMLGYYKDEAKTAETLRNGWLHSGDLGRMDEEGFVYFVDRKKDMIKSGGENVSSMEVEGVIFKHEKVMQVAVIGLPDDYWGEAVTAVVVPYPGMELTAEEIIDYCKESMAGYKVPKKVIVAAEVPVNPSGKIMKRFIKERYLAEGGQ